MNQIVEREREREREREITWFEVGSALLRELQSHVPVHTRYGRSIDKYTQTRLT